MWIFTSPILNAVDKPPPVLESEWGYFGEKKKLKYFLPLTSGIFEKS